MHCSCFSPSYLAPQDISYGLGNSGWRESPDTCLLINLLKSHCKPIGREAAITCLRSSSACRQCKTQGLEWKDRSWPCLVAAVCLWGNPENFYHQISHLKTRNQNSHFPGWFCRLNEMMFWESPLKGLKPWIGPLFTSFTIALFFFFFAFCIKTSCQKWEQNYSKTLRLNQNWNNNNSNCNSSNIMNYLLCLFSCFVYDHLSDKKIPAI